MQRGGSKKKQEKKVVSGDGTVSKWLTLQHRTLLPPCTTVSVHFFLGSAAFHVWLTRFDYKRVYNTYQLCLDLLGNMFGELLTFIDLVDSMREIGIEDLLDELCGDRRPESMWMGGMATFGVEATHQGRHMGGQCGASVGSRS